MNPQNLSKAFLFLVLFIVFGFITMVVTSKAGEESKENRNQLKRMLRVRITML